MKRERHRCSINNWWKRRVLPGETRCDCFKALAAAQLISINAREKRRASCAAFYWQKEGNPSESERKAHIYANAMDHHLWGWLLAF